MSQYFVTGKENGKGFQLSAMISIPFKLAGVEKFYLFCIFVRDIVSG